MGRSDTSDDGRPVAPSEATSGSGPLPRDVLAQLFEAAAIGIVVARADGQLVDVNPMAQVILGRDLDELRGLTFLDVTHPDDLEESIARIEDLVAAGGGSHTLEKRYVRPDQTPVWCRTTVSLLPGEQDATYLLAIIEDVSEQFAAQAELAALARELEQRERRYRTLVENVPGVLYRAQAEDPFELVFISGPVTELFGYQPEELLRGASASAGFVHPDDVAGLFEQLEERRGAVDEPFEQEFRVQHADGSVRWVLDRSRCVHDPATGRFVFDGVLFDITAEKEAERALRERAVQEREAAVAREHVRQLQALARAAIQVSASMETDVTLQRATDAAIAIVGAAAARTSLASDTAIDGYETTSQLVISSEGVVLDVEELGAPDELGGLVEERGEAVRLDGTQLEQQAPGAVRALAQQLGFTPRCWLGAPLIGRDGDVLGLLELWDDRERFSERDEAIVVQLAQMAATAVEKVWLFEAHARQEAQRFREELLAGLSHDMQTPLAAVVGIADLLVDAPDAPAEERLESYAALHRQASGLRNLVRQFLDYTRLQADRKLTLRLRPTPLHRAVEQSVELFAHLRDIEVDLPDDLPRVMADEHRIDQILSNLLSNAIKFSEAPVRVSARVEGDEVVIDVTDDGVGMDDEDLAQLFEKFQRGASSDGIHGTGIGLYIARSVAEAQGGSLTATSQRGVGSTFTLRLPRVTDRSA